jgi:CRP/FNR family transcriptional regulator
MKAMTETARNCQRQSELTGEFFDKLTPQALEDLAHMICPSSYPANVILFSETEEPQRVFVVLEGEVKISINSSDGKRLILCIAKKGEMIGIDSVLSGNPYGTTAETLYPSKLAPIGRQDFLNFLQHHPEAYQLLIKELSRQYSMVCEQLRTVALSTSAPEKLARLLLEWSETGQVTESGMRFRFSLTHGEIGEFIGASRETVTRTLSVFKSRRLVTFHGSSVTISNKAALQDFARC